MAAYCNIFQLMQHQYNIICVVTFSHHCEWSGCSFTVCNWCRGIRRGFRSQFV